MKILHLDYTTYPREAQAQLESHFEVEPFDCPDQQCFYDKLTIEKFDVIFVRLGILTDERAISLQPTLKYIVTPTTGLNHIDVQFAESRGIQVISLKGESDFLANVKSTAEHTWALLLSLIRKIPAAHGSVLEGCWNRRPFLSDELDGKKLGIIGYGRLGKIVGRYGHAFGMEVLVYDHKSEFLRDSFINLVPLNNLLGQADYVLLMISFSKENENFMSAEKFSKLKPDSYFINTSRGELVDEEALLTVLKNGRLKGAAVDVLWNDSSWSESVEGSRNLIDYAKNNVNLIITPHCGGYGKESIKKTRDFLAIKFIRAVTAGNLHIL